MRSLLVDIFAVILSVGFAPFKVCGLRELIRDVGEMLSSAKPKVVTLLLSNDVYKLVGKPDSLMSFTWRSPDLASDRTAFDTFIQDCQGDSEASCFPQAAFDVLPGMGEQHLPGVDWLPIESVCLSKDDAVAKVYRKTTTFGGLKTFGAYQKALKQQLTSADSVAVTINAGDFLGPSYTALTFKGDQFVQMMNHADFDVVAFGNHDFDYNTDNVLREIGDSSFLWVGANVFARNDSKRFGSSVIGGSAVAVAQTTEHATGKQHAPYTASPWLGRGGGASTPGASPDGVVVRKFFSAPGDPGRQVCIFGTTGQEDGQDAANKDRSFQGGLSPVYITDDIEEALRILRDIHVKKKYGTCDLVIAITHARTGRDLKLYNTASRAGLHMDAIIGGHDHYTVFMDLNYGGKHTYLIKTGADGHVLGKLSFIMEAGKDTNSQVSWVPVVEGGCDDACSSSAFEDAWPGCQGWMTWADTLQEVYAANTMKLCRNPLPIAFSGIYDTESARMHETRAINLWVDLVRAGARADVALLFGGGIRQESFIDYPADSHLSELDIFEEFPFQRDNMVVFDIPAGALVPIVERAMHVGCAAAVDPYKVYFSGLELVMRHTPDTNSNCELLEVHFLGGAHVEGIRDLRASRWRTGQTSSLRPGTALYRDGAVLSADAVIRIVVPEYFVKTKADEVAYDGFTAALLAAKHQQMCANPLGGFGDLDKGCDGPNPSAEWLADFTSKQTSFSSLPDMKTPQYVWDDSTPPLSQEPTRSLRKVLQETIRTGVGKEWVVDMAAEAADAFWEERGVSLSDVSFKRGEGDNLPVARLNVYSQHYGPSSLFQQSAAGTAASTNGDASWAKLAAELRANRLKAIRHRAKAGGRTAGGPHNAVALGTRGQL